jgi:choline-sulfatase
VNAPTNVLVILSDQHRADAMGCSGSEVARTPALDRLSAAGVRFDQAYCQSPLCAPSRGSLLTGTHCHTCGLVTQKTPPRFELPTIGTVFRDAGYVTGAFGKMHIPGEDAVHDLGFTERGLRICTRKVHAYADVLPRDRFLKYWAHGAGEWDMKNYNPWNRPSELDESELVDTLAVDRGIRFLEEHGRDAFLLFIGIEKPHPDWYAPARFHDLYDPARMPLPRDFDLALEDVPESMRRRQDYLESHRHTAEEVRGCVAAYLANVSCADHQIGRLLDALGRLGLAGRTVVVYCSDHGETLFEHGWVQKHAFWELLVRVPLILAGPGLGPGGRAVPGIVSLMDLLPTLCELTGVPEPDGLEGRSLVPALDGGALGRDDEAFSEYYWTSPPSRMIRTGRWKYVHTEGETAQLYDMETDPFERRNLARDGGHADVVARLKARVLEGWEIPDIPLDMTARESRYAAKRRWASGQSGGRDEEVP